MNTVSQSQSITTSRYAAYKDSNILWTTKIPSHWGSQKGKWLFKKESRPIREDDEVITCFRDGEVTLRLNRRTEGFTNALQEHGYQGIRKGDLVIHAMDAFAGAIGVSDSEGKSTPVYSVCTPTKIFEVNPFYYAYLLRYMALSGFITSLAKGIRERSTDFRFNDFASQNYPVPSIDEQNRIVSFLDQKTAAIDDAIAKKQRLIELLKEQKAILINRAVTRGLNPDAPMKDSGVDWIGEIPAHWGTISVKRTASKSRKSFVDGDWVELPYITNTGVRLIQTGNVGIGKYKEKGFRYIAESSLKILNCTEVFPNDILICRLDGPVGRACLAPDLGSKMITSVDNAILKPSFEFDSSYLVFVFSSSLWLDWVQAICRAGGGFRFRISRTMLGEQFVPVPPLCEQVKIKNYLNNLDDKIENLIHKHSANIQKLQEYKQTLIAHAVTGKIKVS